jgi:hypothetical protein
MSELKEAALDYVRRGFPVFPVEPGDKRPLGRLVLHGLKDATCDEERVSRWWTEEPTANVGLVTGVVFDVLDVDGPEGIEALNAAAPRDGEASDNHPMNGVDGPTVITGRGGYHVYLGVTGHGNRVGIVPHVDWRGRGGYVVAPPSVHLSGRRYEWLSGGGLERAITTPPDWLLALLRARPTDLDAAGQLVGRAETTSPYARRALEGEVGRVLMAPVGVRNDTLNRAAHALGQLVASGLLDLATAIGALEKAALGAGLDYQEARATIKSGLGAGMRSPRRVTR